MAQYQEELADLNQMIEQNPSDPWAYAKRGAIYHQRGRYDKALADFSRAIELAPTYAWAYAGRGQSYYLLNCYEEALTDFNQAIALTPDSAWTLAHRGVLHYRRLDGRLNYEQALADLTRAIELKPDYAWGLMHRANLYIPMRRYEEALADADRAYALNERIIPHWAGDRGVVLNYLGRYAEAIEGCQQAVQENPLDYFALYSLAAARALSEGVFQAQQEITQARSALESILKVESCGLANYCLGGLAALEGKTTQALDYLQKAIAHHIHHLETMTLASYDLVWLNLYSNQRFQALITASNWA